MANSKLQQTYASISPMLRDKVNVSDALVDKLYTSLLYTSDAVD